MTAWTPVTSRDHPSVVVAIPEVEAKTSVRRWLALAIGSLVAAGLLAILLVIGRLPPLDALFTDPLFFKRCLVVHVDLAIVVWFLGFFAALWFLLPTARRVSPLGRWSPMLALSGLTMMALTAFLPGVQPILANYVPVLDDPLFMVGLVLFGLSMLGLVLDWRLSPSAEASPARAFFPPEARPALRAAGVAVIMAAFTFVAAAWTTPTHLPSEVYFEDLVWGGGHVLQFVSVGAMLAVWLTLLSPMVGPPLPRRVTGILFGVFILPLFAAPLMANTQEPGGRVFFTRLMELGIFPVVTFVLVACIHRIVRSGIPLGTLLRDGRMLGFLASVVLTLVGFGLGASIDGSNTVVPGHYHASIGAVTAAFMTVTYPLVAYLGFPVRGARSLRLSRWQPLVFGAGQVVFALGFAIAGAAGMTRKTYGAEQAQLTDKADQTVGLVVMGVGGLVAVVGGVLFLTLVIRAWRQAQKERHHVRT